LPVRTVLNERLKNVSACDNPGLLG